MQFSPDLLQFLTSDCWRVVSSQSNSSLAVVRLREDVPAVASRRSFPNCLRVLWAYAEPETDALPDSAEAEEMLTFEEHLSKALEHEHLAVLTAVLTFDGARQWVFYTHDVQQCGVRVNAMPQRSERYPIELDAFGDPEWSYLQEKFLDRFRPVA